MEHLQLTIDNFSKKRINVLLIDADSTIPNLALMKLSRYYKNIGANVTLKRLNIPYYPNRKKKDQEVDTSRYDISFCSAIFTGSPIKIKAQGAIFGGTGVCKKIKLPYHIEMLDPDYSIYPENDTSYGFISRGCNRKCSFCFVPEKEGKTNQVSSIDRIVKHKKVKFLDNNFLQLRNHKDILRDIIDKRVKCQFNQGLDIRLIDHENSNLLSKLNYIGEYIFAFDSISYKKTIEKKLKLMEWRKPFNFKFFVYVNPDMDLSETIERIELLREWKCLPYIMRDISCWDDENSDFYTDIASWCNQPSIFKKMGFTEFLTKRHTGKNRMKRIERSIFLYQTQGSTNSSPE